ncbi:MAG: hypothetical protein ACT4PW_00425 [Acidimicrobiia bacterium]
MHFGAIWAAARSRFVAGTVAACVAAGGLAGCGDDEPGGGGQALSPAPTSSFSGPAPTTTAPTTTTTLADLGITVTDPETPDDFRRLAVELVRARNAAYLDPDPTVIERTVARGCTCWEAEYGVMNNLLRAGVHWTKAPFEILGIRLDLVQEPDVFVTMAVKVDEKSVVDEAGNLIEPRAAEPRPSGLELSLFHDDDGIWRIGQIASLDDLRPEVVDALIAEGLP